MSVKLLIDGIEVVAAEGTTIYEAAVGVGVRVPVLCHREGVHPVGGCGVCAVEECGSGRVVLACVTRVGEGMRVRTDSEMALAQRRAALELLLGDHPADCEAPCELACPSGLPVPLMLELVAEGRVERAAALARRYPLECGERIPCELACRRRPYGGAVAICALHRWLCEGERGEGEAGGEGGGDLEEGEELPSFRSRMRVGDVAELVELCGEQGERRVEGVGGLDGEAAAIYEARRCLQCGCGKPVGCVLREESAASGARQGSFRGATRRVVREQGSTGFKFDSARCVLCGVCVRIGEEQGASIAPSFRGRGFESRIAPPLGRSWDDVEEGLLKECVAACPTGAMTWGVFGSA